MIQWQQKLRVQLYYDNGLNKYIVLLTSKQDHTPLGVFCLLQPEIKQNSVWCITIDILNKCKWIN